MTSVKLNAAIRLVASLPRPVIPPEFQEAVDDWIEAAYDTPELDKYLRTAPAVKSDTYVYRVVYGAQTKKMAELKVGDPLHLAHQTSTSRSWDGVLHGVIEPNGDSKYALIAFHLKVGKSYGRALTHSEEDHPENVQDEFLLKPGLTFKLTRIGRSSHRWSIGKPIYFVE